MESVSQAILLLLILSLACSSWTAFVDGETELKSTASSSDSEPLFFYSYYALLWQEVHFLRSMGILKLGREFLLDSVFLRRNLFKYHFGGKTISPLLQL